MDFERMVTRTLAIQSIPSPTLEEGERAEYLLARFRDSALDQVGTDSAGNVVGRLGDAAAPAIVVSAHMDSVFTRAELRPASRIEGRLNGPGVGDNALGLAALLELTEDLQDPPAGASVWLAATVGEEGLGNLRGMFALVDSLRAEARAFVVLEGMTLGHVYHRGLPARRLRLSVRTRGGHSWTHAGQPSAVHELIRLADKLLQLPLPAHPRTTVNLARLEGGSAINAIAAQAAVEIDLRSEDESVVAALESAFILQAQAQATPDVQVECQAIGSRPGGGIAAHHPLVAAAVASLHAQGVHEVVLGAGSTDASAPLSLGLPAVCIGLTRGSMAHSAEETIEIAPIAQGYAAALGTIRAAARLASTGSL